jgi:hypothetical protein
MRLKLYHMGVMVSSIYISEQMQEAGNRKEETGSRKQEAGSRKQEAGSRKQEAGSMKAEGRKPAEVIPTSHHHDVMAFFPVRLLNLKTISIIEG